MNVQDRTWQRESDARTLAEADVIRTTPSRLKGAAKAAGKMAADKGKEVKALKKVAKKPVKKAAPIKKVAKKKAVPKRAVKAKKK